jgi:hypothetical protein
LDDEQSREIPSTAPPSRERRSADAVQAGCVIGRQSHGFQEKSGSYRVPMLSMLPRLEVPVSA